MLNWVLRRPGTRRFLMGLRHWAPGLFLHELLTRPAAVGAICPSSPFLARAMARPLAYLGRLGPDDYVVEIGAGTGNVTNALLEQGIPPERLIIIELSPAFVARLRERFPQLTIIQASATDLSCLLPQGIKVKAIVSSLPLCSLPQAISCAIVQQWHQLLSDSGGLAIQFTYNLRNPRWVENIKAPRLSQRIVWLNLPPARVSCYTFHRPTPLNHEHPIQKPDTNHS